MVQQSSDRRFQSFALVGVIVHIPKQHEFFNRWRGEGTSKEVIPKHDLIKISQAVAVFGAIKDRRRGVGCHQCDSPKRGRFNGHNPVPMGRQTLDVLRGIRWKGA